MNFSDSIRSRLRDYSHMLDGIIELDVDYIDFSITDPTKLSYIQKSRLSLFDGMFWNAELRKKYAVMTKPHKLLKGLFCDIGEKEINLIYNKLFPSNTKLLLLEGEAINQIFEREKIFTDTGDLCSCMVSNFNLDKYEIYRDNCKALVLQDDLGMIHARAILWPSIKISECESIQFMDRVYAHLQEDRIQLLQWAKDNDIIYRVDVHADGYDTDRSNGGYRGYRGKYSGSDIEVTLTKDVSSYSRLPFMDSLKYCINKSPVLKSNSNGCRYELNNYTSGIVFEHDDDEDEDDDDNTRYCVCGCGLQSDDDGDFTAIDGELYHDDCRNICYSDRYGRTILRECAHYNEYVGTYINDDDDDFITDINGCEVLLEDCTAIRSGRNRGSWALDTELRQCSICGSNLHEDDEDCCEDHSLAPVIEEKEELQLTLDLR